MRTAGSGHACDGGASKKGEVTFDTPEHLKPATAPGTLGKVKPVFKKDGGVTAGHASDIDDRAFFVLAASLGHKPKTRIVIGAVAGVPNHVRAAVHPGQRQRDRPAGDPGGGRRGGLPARCRGVVLSAQLQQAGQTLSGPKRP